MSALVKSSLPYNTIGMQRERIIARLRHGPATRIELEQQENIPDATARIHELRKTRFDIRTDYVTIANRDGTVTNVARYTLHDGDEKQGDLFADEKCAAR